MVDLCANKEECFVHVLTSPTLTDMSRVIELSKIALDDLPDPNFSAIAANIKACSVVK